MGVSTPRKSTNNAEMKDDMEISILLSGLRNSTSNIEIKDAKNKSNQIILNDENISTFVKKRWAKLEMTVVNLKSKTRLK